jgi:hypothetical protein
MRSPIRVNDFVFTQHITVIPDRMIFQSIFNYNWDILFLSRHPLILPAKRFLQGGNEW